MTDQAVVERLAEPTPDLLILDESGSEPRRSAIVVFHRFLPELQSP